MSASKSDSDGRRVFVALSGGVDSAVAAAILLRAGCDVSAIFLRHRRQPSFDADESRCRIARAAARTNVLYCAPENDSFIRVPSFPDGFRLPMEAAIAMETAASLHIDFTLFDADRLFESVVDRFVECYYDGRTPNPCVHCNRELKFGTLYDAAKAFGAAQFATGHYVRLLRHDRWLEERRRDRSEESVPEWLLAVPGDTPLLARGNIDKDQSYVLYSIRRDRLASLRFPLGEMTKPEVRVLAQEFGLGVAEKKESQEICFVEDGKREDFLSEYTDGRVTTGNFVALDGTVLAPHRGYERYTVGQRKGFGVGFGQRIFVQRIDPTTRDVVLGPYDSLAQTRVYARNALWHCDVPVNTPFVCDARIRYRNKAQRATVTVDETGLVSADFETPRYGVAPGQSLVCYWGDRLLGGGIITTDASLSRASSPVDFVNRGR